MVFNALLALQFMFVMLRIIGVTKWSLFWVFSPTIYVGCFMGAALVLAIINHFIN